uniref:Variable lymphocyte receptor A n=1 Tax=Eptatretus burgeri TaxID=7764 RepID=A0A8C4NI02_EPTBU
MMGPVLAACLLIILSTAWISQANEALCKKDGGVCSCNNNKNSVDCSSKRLTLTAIPSNIPVETTELRLNFNSLSSLKAFHRWVSLAFRTRTFYAHCTAYLVDLLVNFTKRTLLSIVYLQYNDLNSNKLCPFEMEHSFIQTMDPNPWDCSCNDILYLSKWIREKEGTVNGIESATCVDNKAVLEFTTVNRITDHLHLTKSCLRSFSFLMVESRCTGCGMTSQLNYQYYNWRSVERKPPPG